MKQLILFSAAILISVFLISSCKNEDKTKTTSEKIQAKWQIESITDNEHYDNEDHPETYTGLAADYIDFRNDGKVYTYVQAQYDTSFYTVQGDSKIIITTPGLPEADTFAIQTLSDNVLKFYEKVIEGDEFTEATYNLKK